MASAGMLSLLRSARCSPMHPSTAPPCLCMAQHLRVSLRCSLGFCASTDLAPAAQAQLRSLALVCDHWNDDADWGTLRVAGLLALTALQSLQLSSCAVQLGSWQGGPAQAAVLQPSDGLPPSLTSLIIDGFEDEPDSPEARFVPPQVSGGCPAACAALAHASTLVAALPSAPTLQPACPRPRPGARSQH